MANLKIAKIAKTDNETVYEIYPLERGYGHTYGTPIRRILLSSIEGFALTKVKVKGVDHEFTSLKGLKEDVIRVILNLQKIVFRLESAKTEKVILKTKGAGKVFAKDIRVPGNVTIVNPDIEIAELTEKSAALEIEAVLESGFGYEVADDELRNSEIGWIPLNKNFTPVTKVNVNVESTRVGQRTDFDKLVLTVETNGAVTPDEAFKQAIKKFDEEVEELYSLSKELE